MTQPELPWGLKLGAVVLVILGSIAVIAGFSPGFAGLHAFGIAMQGSVILTTGIFVLVHHKHAVQISTASAVLFTIACLTHGLTIFDLVQIGLIWSGYAWYRRWRGRVDTPQHAATVGPDVKTEQSLQPAAATPESLDVHDVRPAMRHELDVNDPLAVLAQAYADPKPLEPTTNSSQSPVTSTAAQGENSVVFDEGDIGPMLHESKPAPSSSKTGLIWFVSALALLIGAVFIWVLWSEKQKQERRDIEMAAFIADSLGSKQTDAATDASPKDGGHSLSATGPAKASAAKQTSRRASLVSPAADKPKNDAVLGSAYTVSACPPSLPAGTKPKLFSPEELKKVVGTKAELSEAGPSVEGMLYDRALWEAALQVLNRTNHCISVVELELTLQYKGLPLKERHTVSFKPILGPGQEGHEDLTLHRRTKKNGDPLGLQEWRVTKVWGFHYPTSD